LHRVDEWLSEYMDGKGERAALANKYNDDRLARTLDYTFDVDPFQPDDLNLGGDDSSA